MSNISYSAVVLNDKSKQRLINKFTDYIPNEFELNNSFHMTINMGEINPEYKKYVGISVQLEVINYAITNNMFIIGVKGFFSENIKPYISLATNKKDSSKINHNDLDWINLKHPIKISGKVTEVEIKFE
jgi:hypothetical protein